ncbi:MAG: TIGR00282 family metallophosphoesterase [Kurthia gibsonii]|uniref:TIGR00282 family metallophosphoesterase n=1 Tax=Kurthia gibsonii TaxID=33946 RepID=A0ABU9LH85_9BACL|nr:MULTISPECIES: TIGR00282 family metallophosphoesterase [Kurthia]MCA9724577.1 TIGR00282 family metallophosphoesterase [Kurthia sp.]AMA62466.1 calcineurin-like phosphoesterase family protein [Kurthia sp. 11kri321]MEB6111661.1 TIGR00282 family metallophosphoesterase [Kurthia gibsonii]MEB7771833.1 TIGR00282 family metallophosphoesterase [Kurthia gibsonii]RXH52975.1 TIGR00282 family metallophosphoesterase [Kurthia gibsonii]
MKVLFIGDIVGDLGIDAVEKYLPRLKKKYQIDVVIANGENAAKGRGITKRIYQDLLMMGVDVITMGNHTWDQREIYDFIDDTDYLIRPANFSKEAPGKGMTTITKNGQAISVINLHGRVFLPAHDEPFAMAEELIAEAKKQSPIVFVDFHAETTSEKIALGWHLAGQASVVVGTHTHVQTADERILPGGTAYISDVGMTGPYDEVLGMKKESVIYRFKTNMPVRFEVPERGAEVLSAFFVEIDDKNGQATHCERILINKDHPFKG